MPEGGDDLLQLVVVTADAALESGKLRGELGLSSNPLAETEEGTNDEDAHLYSAGAVEHGRGHDRPMLSEGQRGVLHIGSALQGHRL